MPQASDDSDEEDDSDDSDDSAEDSGDSDVSDDDDSEGDGDSDDDSDDGSADSSVMAPVQWWDSWKGKERDAEHRDDERVANIPPPERYSRPNELWRVLESGAVRLVRSSYLISIGMQQGVTPRRQELPEHAFLPLPALRAIHADASPLLTSSSFDGLVPIIAVSACWLSADHADPDGSNLLLIAKTLETECAKYKVPALDGGHGFREVGVFWDWLSLEQPSPQTGKRTAREQARFEAALLEMDL